MDDVLDKIYYYKHNLEYRDVMDELLQTKINCYYNISLNQVRNMFYIRDGMRIRCVDISSIEPSIYKILKQIKSK